MSEKTTVKDENVVETDDKEYFCYATGGFYKDKERTKAINKKGTIKGKFTYYEFGRQYLTLVSKNTLKLAETKEGESPSGVFYYAEDLIRLHYHYLTINQLKRRIKNLLTQLEDRGVVVQELEFKSVAIKAASKKSKVKTLDDLVAELDSFVGVESSRSAIKKARKATRSETVANREAYNTKKLNDLFNDGVANIGSKAYSLDVKMMKSREKFLAQFAGKHRGSDQDLKTKGFVKNETVYSLFVKKQGRVAELNSDEFFAFLTKYHASHFPK